jgi:hypothetical protein
VSADHGGADGLRRGPFRGTLHLISNYQPGPAPMITCIHAPDWTLQDDNCLNAEEEDARSEDGPRLREFLPTEVQDSSVAGPSVAALHAPFYI